MIVIIDAYNVLKQLKKGIISQEERILFIKKVTTFTRNKQITMVIVFDGGDCTWPLIDKEQGLVVVYSGERLSADDYIRQYMKEHKNKESLLVTDDRELKKNAQMYGIDIIKSLDFYALLSKNNKKIKNDTQKSQNTIKTALESSIELDTLMQSTDMSLYATEENDRSERIPTGFTASKKERKINKKMKKLL